MTEEQTLDLTNFNNEESNVEENIEENIEENNEENNEEERLAQEAAAKAEEERLAREVAAKAEEERLAQESSREEVIIRDKDYMIKLATGKKIMTEEDKKYIEGKLDSNRLMLFKRTRPSGVVKFLRTSINDTMY
jgi:hypothetical protein